MSANVINMPFVLTTGKEQGKAIAFNSLNEKPDNTWTHQLSLALLHNRMLQSQKTQVLSQCRKPQAVCILIRFPTILWAHGGKLGDRMDSKCLRKWDNCVLYLTSTVVVWANRQNQNTDRSIRVEASKQTSNLHSCILTSTMWTNIFVYVFPLQNKRCLDHYKQETEAELWDILTDIPCNDGHLLIHR